MAAVSLLQDNRNTQEVRARPTLTPTTPKPSPGFIHQTISAPNHSRVRFAQQSRLICTTTFAAAAVLSVLDPHVSATSRRQ